MFCIPLSNILWNELFRLFVDRSFNHNASVFRSSCIRAVVCNRSCRTVSFRLQVIGINTFGYQVVFHCFRSVFRQFCIEFITTSIVCVPFNQCLNLWIFLQNLCYSSLKVANSNIYYYITAACSNITISYSLVINIAVIIIIII